MKKWILVASITIFILSVSAVSCFCQTDRSVANTSKKGSLLIWPLITTSTDTIITLTNDYYQGVKVRCTYRTPFPFAHSSWIFTLRPNQTVSWLAATGRAPDGQALPRAKGVPPAIASGVNAELRCWAVNTGGAQQIVWNWLAGEAIVKKGANQSWGYSAWRFAVNSSTTGANAGTAGQILLTGDTGNYDSCPTGLMFNFLKQTSSAVTFPKGTVDNVLTLVPCMEDVKLNTGPTVFTSLLTYNESQSYATGASVCVGSTTSATQWFSESLLSSKVVLAAGTVNPFFNLATPGGAIYIHGKQDSRCTGSTGVPLIGVMSTQFTSPAGPVAGVPPTAIGPGQAYLRNASDANTTTPISIKW